METLIGIDIGTTTVKAVLMEAGGRPLARYDAAYPSARPRPGHVEQDPADWMAHVRAALARFAVEPGAASVRGIGLTSQVNTHVFTDRALRPLAPAIVWQDLRAGPQAARIDSGIAAADRLAWWGGPMPVDASHALARMAWMAETRPEVWAATAHVLLPKDYCIACLTGAVAADPIAAVGLVGADLAYVAPLLDRLDGAASRLAPLADPLASVGRVRPGEPFAGMPVVLGTMDAWAGMIGLGCLADGEAIYLSGTSEVLGILSPRQRPAPVVVFPPWSGMRLHAAPTQAGGAALDWAARLLGRLPADLVRLAAGAALRPASPLFLPHLGGERAPLWDAAARGAFAGLDGATGPAELALAVLEGVAFAARLAFEALEVSADTRPAAIRAGGGGMQADAWCRIRADALSRPLARVAVREVGALGAAVMAGVGSGLMPGLAEAASGLVHTDRTFAPDPEGAALADERFATWRALYDGLKPVNARLTPT